MTPLEMELVAKYHWRIKYPKTFEMAVRNKFLGGELPSETIAELVRHSGVTTIDLQASFRKRQQDNPSFGAGNQTNLPVSQLRPRRRGRQHRHTELTRGSAQQGGLDTNACLEEILERLTWIESTLSAVLER